MNYASSAAWCAKSVRFLPTGSRARTPDKATCERSVDIENPAMRNYPTFERAGVPSAEPIGFQETQEATEPLAAEAQFVKATADFTVEIVTTRRGFRI